ncbi:uncharacterized protein MKZ38_005041 [Zalerion maritima]|uniref:C3H1-type domain-containing protein n=1 Tax=Zalerion maritima TaxID=339359 RepID=A0AAD5WQM3_9PEZI|nr:uncharacterized protein MKZ38_005041 [Zalerion maritima]
MFGDDDIERAAGDLADYRTKDALSSILDQYSALIDDYRRLKSDYEEERESREKYKQMAKGQERNPFVLVLVDGDGYVFHETLVEQGAGGGRIAAQTLDKAVKASLRVKGLEHCQVMVRIYANVAGLSKALSRAGVVGAEKRSLAPFIASFNRSYGLAEFVDAGELKENADFKLRALLNLYADNAQCKHIYFAACHDVGYISDLTPHMGNNRKFTLVDSPGIRFHDEFAKLDIGIEELPGVFRSTPLDSAIRFRPSSYLTVTSPPPAQSPAAATCRFYTLGNCKYGEGCKNVHPEEKASTNTTTWGQSSRNGHPQSGENGHLVQEGNGSRPSSSLSMRQVAEGASTNSITHGNRRPGLDSLAIHKLPKKEDVRSGHVAVNRNNFRLDTFIPPSSAETTSRLKSLINAGRRVCNNYHLNGGCEAGSQCGYSHEPLDEEFIPALEWLARAIPCPRRGSCRNGACTNGHICQTLDCKHRGGKMYCKLPYRTHAEDLALSKYVPVIAKAKQAKLQRRVSPPPADDESSTTSSTTNTSNGVGVDATDFVTAVLVKTC